MIPKSLIVGKLKISPPVILAPMAGVADQPFRLIAKEFGPGLMFTEFVSSEGVIRKHQRTFEYAHFSDAERPIAIQIFGSEPSVIAESAVILEELYKPDLIDLNFGCPVRKVVKKGAGAALLKNPDLIEAICKETVKRCKTPISAKIRSGWDQHSINVLEIAGRIEDSGISLLTVHPRTASMGYSGEANWSLIRDVRKALTIPVVGNGDVVDPVSAEKMFMETGCDAIMIGRGALGNPWIFQEVVSYLYFGERTEKPSPQEKINLAMKHTSLAVELKGKQIAAMIMKKHLGWYLKGFPDASRLRKMINQAKSIELMQKILKEIETDIEQKCLQN